MIQARLHKALKGKPIHNPSKDATKSNMSYEDWENLDLKAESQIRMCLTKNVLANVHRISIVEELWQKLRVILGQGCFKSMLSQGAIS